MSAGSVAASEKTQSIFNRDSIIVALVSKKDIVTGRPLLDCQSFVAHRQIGRNTFGDCRKTGISLVIFARLIRNHHWASFRQS